MVLGHRDRPEVPGKAGQGTRGGVRIRHSLAGGGLCQFITTLLTYFRDCLVASAARERNLTYKHKPGRRTELFGTGDIWK